MTIQCCVCKKVKVEEYWAKTQPDRPSEVSHTYCPTCLGLSQASMAVERIRANAAHPVSA